MAMGANATELSELSAVGVQLSACRAGAFENPVVVQVFFDDAERSPGYHTFGSRAERHPQGFESARRRGRNRRARGDAGQAANVYESQRHIARAADGKARNRTGPAGNCV